MDIGNLLELERAFACESVIKSSANEEKAGGILIAFNYLFDSLLQGENLFNIFANCQKAGGEGCGIGISQLFGCVCKSEGKQIENRYLNRICLGAGNRNFGTCMGEYNVISLTSDRRTCNIYDSEDRQMLYLQIYLQIQSN